MEIICLPCQFVTFAVYDKYSFHGRCLKCIRKCLDVNCVTCPYVSPGKEVKSTATGETFDINSPVSCDTENIIYCITCKRCQQQYVGQSGKGLGVRFAQHRGYVNNYFKHQEAGKATQPTGEHFNSAGHQGVIDMDLKIIEKVFSKSEAVRRERESFYIKKFQVVSKGINRKS